MLNIILIDIMNLINKLKKYISEPENDEPIQDNPYRLSQKPEELELDPKLKERYDSAITLVKT